jgi:hypothetical protein
MNVREASADATTPESGGRSTGWCRRGLQGRREIVDVEMAYGWTRRFAVVGLARVIGMLADPDVADATDEQATRRFEAMLADLGTPSDQSYEAGAA